MMELDGGSVYHYAAASPTARPRLSDYAELGHELGERVWNTLGHDIFEWPRRHRDMLFGLDGHESHAH